MTQILGPDGRPLDMAAVMRSIGEPQTSQIGTIQTEFDKHPSRGLTPARLQNIMSQAEQGDLTGQLELAEDMEERDAHLYAELGKRRGAITALSWSIEEPPNASADEKKLTEQVRDWVGMLTAHANGVDGGMEVLIGAMTAAVLPGFAPIEMEWPLQRDATGRMVRVPHCKLQPHRWFTTSADRRRFLLRSQTKLSEAQNSGGAVLLPKMGEELWPFSWLMHVHPARNGYIARMSLARVLFWPYLFKNYSVRDLAEFLEIYGIPPRIGYYPSGASDQDKLTLLQAVTRLGHNAAATMPQSMKLEFMAAAIGTEVPFVAMWDRMDAAESKAILGQTLSASEGQKGSHALGQVHEEVRMDIRAADARLYEGSFTRQVIAPMCALNVPGVNMRRLPRLALDTGEPEDMALYAENLPKLAQAGLRIEKKWVYGKLRIPEPAPDAEVLNMSAPAPALPAADDPAATNANVVPIKPKPKAAALKAQVGETADDVFADLAAEAAGDWQPQLGPMVSPLFAELDRAIAAGESIESFRSRLPELVTQMDYTSMGERLARTTFVGALNGAAGLEP